jgi:hypothetical protein
MFMQMGPIRPGGQASEAMGRTKGGLNTKIHALVNARSQAVVIALSGGNQADISLAEELTECLPEHFTLIGDKAYDSWTLTQTAATKKINTFILARSNRTTTVSFSARALPTSSPCRKLLRKNQALSARRRSL